MALFVRQAILFDLDGVLVDSTACAGRIWKIWAQEQGLDPERMVQLAHGRPTIETIRMVAPQLDAKFETAKIEEREVNDVDGLKALPGARELLYESSCRALRHRDLGKPPTGDRTTARCRPARSREDDHR